MSRQDVLIHTKRQAAGRTTPTRSRRFQPPSSLRHTQKDRPERGGLFAGGDTYLEATGAQGCGYLGGKGLAGPGEGSGGDEKEGRRMRRHPVGTTTKTQDGVCLTTVRRLRRRRLKRRSILRLFQVFFEKSEEKVFPSTHRGSLWIFIALIGASRPWPRGHPLFGDIVRLYENDRHSIRCLCM
jgi:hypothetical protein